MEAENQEYIRLVYVNNIVFNLFHATGLFLYTLETSENIRGFVIFAGGIEKQ